MKIKISKFYLSGDQANSLTAWGLANYSLEHARSIAEAHNELVDHIQKLEKRITSLENQQTGNNIIL